MKVARVCKCCGAQFTAKSADVKRGWALFCSKRCKALKQQIDRGGTYYHDHYYHLADDPSWDAHKLEG